MINAHPEFGVAMTEKEYAKEWEVNSRYFKDSGQYDWMLKQLGEAGVVLEIGCGSGVSTSKIASSGAEVLAVEVNKNAVNAAAVNLRALGYEVAVLTVDEFSGWMPGSGAKITILSADIFSEEVVNALPKFVFDALLCWMTGSYPEHIGNILDKHFEEFEGAEMSEYRIKVQQRSYEIGSHILKDGGLVHIVDRAAMNSWNDKDELRLVLAETQGELAGPNFKVGKEDTMFNKLAGSYNTSNIQYIKPSEGKNAHVNVLASSKAHKSLSPKL